MRRWHMQAKGDVGIEGVFMGEYLLVTYTQVTVLNNEETYATKLNLLTTGSSRACLSRAT
jgi:hypothetical protein